MFSTFGRDEVIKDVYRIAAPYAGSPRVTTVGELRSVFHNFLSRHQPYMPVNRADDPFIVDAGLEDALVRAYSFNNTLDDLRQTQIIGDAYPLEVKLERIDFARRALDRFLSLDEELAAVFDLAIHSIVVRPSDRPGGRASYGGSSSAAIGVIWLSLGPTVTELDVVEMLLHELTHHLLFIDERSFAHFDYAQMTREENRAYSAILNLRRPIDKVFHSIVVATELVLGRHSFLPPGPITVHPPTDKLSADTVTASASLTDLDRTCGAIEPRGHEILARCLERCGVEPATPGPGR